ncbi:phosphatidylinositol phosphatase PTPRQ-like [Dysidea avara]|uniref:phosphatidylinositol phosphatase PTPRQ-like n=1 Tax=Dysidea avara TaxID=196820 RepID=UPI00331DF83D
MLHPSYNYTVRIAAATVVGMGSFSRSITVMTPEDAPDSPQNISAAAADSTTIIIRWIPPNVTNGKLRYYTVVIYTSGVELKVNVSVMILQQDAIMMSSSNSGSDMDIVLVEAMANSSGVTVLVSGLHPFTNYTFYVLAVTVTPSEPSDSVTVLTDEAAPDQPQNVRASVINSTIVEVTWYPPSITNGILRYYTVVYGSSDNMEMIEVNSSDATSSKMGKDVSSGEMDTVEVDPSEVTSSGTGENIGSDEMEMMEVNPRNMTILVSGLDPFTNYTFYVLAVTVTPSEPSDNVTVLTDEAAPSAPVNVTSHNISSTSIMVTWQPPISPNGIVRSYHIKYSSGNFSDDINTTNISIIINMLEIFTTYQVQVFATTITEGDGSEIVNVTTDEDVILIAILAPSTPVNVTSHNISSTSIMITWQPPITPNGIVRSYRIVHTTEEIISTDTNYTMQYSNVKAFHTIYVPRRMDEENKTNNISITIHKLKIFTTYQVQVFATTVTEGNGSEIVNVTTDEDVPGTPNHLFVNGIINSTSIVVTWSEPDVTNGIITMYEVYFNKSSFGDNTTNLMANTTTNTSIIIGGLDPSTVYSVAVRAYTRVGDGELTDIFNIQPNPNSSSPPVGFMVMVLNSTTVKLSWQYPESPNGEIRGYSILYSSIPDNEMMILNITLDTVDDTSNQTTIVSGLTPFTYYGFRARAFSFGDQNKQRIFVQVGISTNEIIMRTDEDVPGPPTNFTTHSITSTAIQVSWEAPSVTNGIILNYTVSYSNTTYTSILVFINDVFRIKISQLNEDTWYNFTIYTNTSAGASPYVNTTGKTHEDRPSAPPQNITTMVINSTSISVFWDPPPFSDQNGVITGYRVSFTNVNRSSILIKDIIQSTVTATNLKEFEVYSITIAANTFVGRGPFSAPVSNETLKDANTIHNSLYLV